MADETVRSPFEYLNKAYRSLFSSDVDIFSPASLSPAARTNMVCTDDGSAGETVYKKADAALPGRIDFTIDIASADPLYLYITGDTIQSARILVNEEHLYNYFGHYSWRTILLGQYDPGSTVTLSIETDENQLSFEEVHAVYESAEALSHYHALAGSRECSISSDTDSRITAEVSAPTDCTLVLTIPFDDGWKVTMDGKACKTSPALGVLTAVDIPSGEHIVSLRYVPPGAVAGMVISLLSLGLVVCAMVFDRRRPERMDAFLK